MKATKRRTASKVYRRPAKRKPAKPTAIVVQAPDPKPWLLTQDEVGILKNAVCKGATDEELKYCLAVARRYELDPFQQQIWFVPRWDSQAQNTEGTKGGKVFVPVVGINGLLHIAARDHADFGTYSEVEYGPMVDVEWTDYHGKKQEFKAPEWARIEARKKGIEHTTVAKVWWDEIYPDVDKAPLVRRMPRLMLGKVARAHATRTSYPKTGGLLIPEETHTREFQDITPGGRVFAPVQSGGSVAAAQAVGQRIIEEKKKKIAERTAPQRDTPKEGASASQVNDPTGPQGSEKARRVTDAVAPSPKPLMTIEYVDPAKSKCAECECFFGIHLKTCSHFIDPQGPKTSPPPKTEAAYEAKTAAAVKGAVVKVYHQSIGGIGAWLFQKEPAEPLAYLLDHGLKDIAVFAQGAQRWYIVDDASVVASVKKVAAEFGITIEKVTGPGPMAPVAAEVPPSTVKAAPEPLPTGETATIQSAEEKSNAEGTRLRLFVMFGGRPHTCFDKKLWPFITGSIGQSAEFDVEVSKDGKWRTITGIRRIGKREYDQLGPIRTMDDSGQASLY